MNRFILDLYRVAVQLNTLSFAHRTLFEGNNELKNEIYFDIPYIDNFKKFARALNFRFTDEDVVIDHSEDGETTKTYMYFIPHFLLESDIESVEKWFLSEIERIKKEIEKEDKLNTEIIYL